MERVVSSMNSTRTWVTPPREPFAMGGGTNQHLFSCVKGRRRGPNRLVVLLHTGSAEDSGDLDELDGSLGGIHLCDLFGYVTGRRIGRGIVMREACGVVEISPSIQLCGAKIAGLWEFSNSGPRSCATATCCGAKPRVGRPGPMSLSHSQLSNSASKALLHRIS